MLLTKCSTDNKTTRQMSLSFSDKFKQSNCLILHIRANRLELRFPLECAAYGLFVTESRKAAKTSNWVQVPQNAP